MFSSVHRVTQALSRTGRKVLGLLAVVQAPATGIVPLEGGKKLPRDSPLLALLHYARLALGLRREVSGPDDLARVLNEL